jgi:quinoprotein glucose dehydrogenase
MNPRMKTILIGTAALFAIAGLSDAQDKKAASPAATPANYSESKEWPTYGHDSGGMRYSPLKQITPANVSSLKVAWTYHLKPEGYVAPAGGRGGPGGAPGGGGRGGSGGGRGAGAADGAPAGPPQGAPLPGAAAAGRGGGGRGGNTGFRATEVTPLVINGTMYIASPYGQVVALDPTSGKEVWVYKMPNGDNPALRGVEYFAGDKITPPEIVVGTGAGRLLTLDAKTGALNTNFGVDGIVDLNTPEIRNGLPNGNAGVSSPPVMYQNLIIVGDHVQEGSGPGVAGDVRAFDIHDGKLVWAFHSIPRPGETNFGTWAGDSWKQRSGVNVWGLMTVDAARGIVYMPFGAPSGDLFGGDRPGDDLYDTSLVAADAKTGKYLWHFQLVHHDIWDFDLESPPVLMDIRRNGKVIPSVGVFGKSSLLYLLDRTSGKPIYDVSEKAVMQSDVPGEKTSPTQPFPYKPAPLARIDFDMKDIATVTPELEAGCRKLIADNNIQTGMGPFAPPTYNHSRVIFPSEIGGSNWGGGSFNPQLGYLFINVSDLGQLNGVKDPASGPVNLATLPGSNVQGGRTGPYANGGPGGRFRDAATGMFCSQPPWGELVAVNVNTGDIAWRVPLGITESLPPEKQKTGRPSQGGPITTASGLVFIGAADDNRFRAFDGKTGKELWSTKLNASAESVPATYLGKDGGQYVVVTGTGGGDAGAPVTSDEITAFRLP